MKLTTAINKLDKAGFKVVGIIEGRLYQAIKKVKERLKLMQIVQEQFMRHFMFGKMIKIL